MSEILVHKRRLPHQIASCKQEILPALVPEIYLSKVAALIFFSVLSYLTSDPTLRQLQVAEEGETVTGPKHSPWSINVAIELVQENSSEKNIRVHQQKQ